MAGSMRWIGARVAEHERATIESGVWAFSMILLVN